MEEKRKYSRWIIENKKAILKEHKEDEVPLIDLSTGGMRIKLKEEIPLGSTISGQFNINPHLGTYFIKGKVVWSKHLSRENKYEVGVKFDKINTIPHN